MPTSTNRNAVVLIHGMGEQRPIETLRDFVTALTTRFNLNKPENEKIRFWEKPAPHTGTYETRKMTTCVGDNDPDTDFYEFYWAHHMSYNKYGHILSWLGQVLRKNPTKMERSLLPLYITLLIVSIGFLVSLFYTYPHCLKVPFCHGTLHVNGAAIVFIFSLVLFYGLTKAFILPYIGDAGRYMDPAPYNIDKRQIIREEGVNLLKKIHESDNEYNSVIIVAHSLGSVIAYDLIKFLWNEYHETADPNKLQALDDKAKDEWMLRLNNAEKIGHDIDPNAGCEDYQKAQQTCFEYLKTIGNKWLITDFVTMGSPLTHAGHLLVQQGDLFKHLKEQREYPTCPPTLDEHKKTNLWQAKNIKYPGFEQTFDYTHYNHSSPFAVTRWTNYYFSTDFLGGSLAKKFGFGIKDVQIPFTSIVKFLPKGHTDYWNIRKPNHIVEELLKITTLNK